MARFAPGLFGFFLFAFWVWAVLDVIATDQILIRNLEKTIWLFLVLLFPPIGAIAWILLGRPVNAGFSPGSTAVRRNPPKRGDAPRGPEDDPNWRP